MVPDVLSWSGSQGFTWNVWHDFTGQISFQAAMIQDTLLSYSRLILDEMHPTQYFSIVGSIRKLKNVERQKHSMHSKCEIRVCLAYIVLYFCSSWSHWLQTKVIGPLIRVKYWNLAAEVINNQLTVCRALGAEADSTRQLFVSQYAD